MANQGPGVGKRIVNFFTESWQELKKVSWPSKSEVKNFTWVVIATVAVVGLSLFIFDNILGLLMSQLLGN